MHNDIQNQDGMFKMPLESAVHTVVIKSLHTPV